jgi:hypothetical protein
MTHQEMPSHIRNLKTNRDDATTVWTRKLKMFN